MPSLRLVSFDLCPFVQRSAIALEEKGIDYDMVYIDLRNKPDWFMAISPHGKVPVLLVGDVALFESAVILEYLDETHAPRLHPDDPLDRALDRSWFSVVDAMDTALYRMMCAVDKAELAAHARTLCRHLARLEARCAGPLWRGEALCAMDVVAYPALQRTRWFDALYPSLGLFADTPRLAIWEATLGRRPAMAAAALPDIQERFHAALRVYGPAHRGPTA